MTASLDALRRNFETHFGAPPEVVAYAPGRVEVLGNHTDYNEGYVLSAAMDRGLWFACRRRPDAEAHLFAPGIAAEATFAAGAPAPLTTDTWPNYIIGVYAGLRRQCGCEGGFDAAMVGDVPLGAGLSSSAALEMASGLGLARLFGATVDPLDLARIGQRAEHDFAGANCGLMDQITSLFGQADSLVLTDFRTLAVTTVPMHPEAVLLVVNSNVKHSLVEGEYNERRARCEESVAFFRRVLPHRVQALRDVTQKELHAHSQGMDAITARRAAHVIGENERVLRGAALLQQGDLAGFGALMFHSHESSRDNFENSCPELDYLVEQARRQPGVLGARLSGGGFGGSMVALARTSEAPATGQALARAYEQAFGRAADVFVIRPSAGARVLEKIPRRSTPIDTDYRG